MGYFSLKSSGYVSLAKAVSIGPEIGTENGIFWSEIEYEFCLLKVTLRGTIFSATTLR